MANPRPRSHGPTKDELLSARGLPVPDITGPGLKVLFCGINPGLYSGAVGHHFARPGNRFWATLFRAGFTDRLMAPSDERELLRLGYGITNIVNFATGQARELSPQMLRTGAAVLRRKTAELRPRLLAVLGIDAYSKAFGRPGARASLQPEGLDGAELWVLPNPSGINAGYRMEDLVRAFSELRARAGNL